jgi:hypothetical protein
LSRRLIIFVVSASLLFLCPRVASSQGVSIVPNAGISKDMRSVSSNRWNLGFDLGLNIFVKTSEMLSIGGRIAYHSWGADGDGWAKDYVGTSLGSYTIDQTTGSQSVLEFVPSLKVALSGAGSRVKVDIQAGPALVIVGSSEVKVSGRFSSSFSSGQGSITIHNGSMTGFGLQAGLPISISDAVQVLPLYTLYWADGDAYHHITFNIGIILGK